MKTASKMLVLSLLFATPAFAAEGGNELPGGGDAMVAQFRSIAIRLIREIVTLNFVPDVENADLTQLQKILPEQYARTKVASTDSRLVLPDGREVDAINYPGPNPRIEFNRTRWLLSQGSLHDRRVLVLHEYLGLIGTEKDHYRVSQAIITEIEKLAELKPVARIRNCEEFIEKLMSQQEYSRLELADDIDCRRQYPLMTDMNGFWSVELDTEFDGHGFTIDGLKIGSVSNAPSVRLQNVTALFSVVRKPLRRVRFTNLEVSGVGQVGGVAALNYSDISDLYVEGAVTGGWVGGIVFRNFGQIIHVTTNLKIESAGMLMLGIGFRGGVAGVNEGFIARSTAFGSINGGYEVGGITGRNIGTILECGSYLASISGDDIVGGMVGANLKAGRIVGGRVNVRRISSLGKSGPIVAEDEGLTKDVVENDR